MADYPRSNNDRLANLETELARLRDELRGVQSRRDKRHTNVETFLARTAEKEPDTPGAHGYPATTSATLPVIFLDIEDSGGLTFTDRQEYARHEVISPFGWLPPDLEVEVANRNGKWRIVRCPIALRGKLESGIGAASASWSGSGYTGVCDEWLDGQAWVHVYRLNTTPGAYEDHGATYTPQQYSNGDDVLMKVNAVTNVAIGEENLVNFRLNADRQWEIDIAWCSGAPTCD